MSTASPPDFPEGLLMEDGTCSTAAREVRIP